MTNKKAILAGSGGEFNGVVVATGSQTEMDELLAKFNTNVTDGGGTLGAIVTAGNSTLFVASLTDSETAPGDLVDPAGRVYSPEE